MGFFSTFHGDNRNLHYFPTRRSSDLAPSAGWKSPGWCSRRSSPRNRHPATGSASLPAPRPPPRSEEHTSELQSRRDIVCRLLLEKKKFKFYLASHWHNSITISHVSAS